MTQPVTSWSYSRFALYTTCPAKFKYTHIDKLPEVKGDALLRGAAVHEQAEGYLKGTVARLPPPLQRFADEFKALRTARRKHPTMVGVEEAWAFRENWTQTTWDDWSGAWLRVKLDVTERNGPLLRVTDLKTGKYRPDNVTEYEDQLSLYAVGALTIYAAIPDLRVTTRLLYLDHGITHPPPDATMVYTRKDLKPLRRDWERRVKPLFADRKFAPRANRFCPWCSFRKNAGGPCPL